MVARALEALLQEAERGFRGPSEQVSPSLEINAKPKARRKRTPSSRFQTGVGTGMGRDSESPVSSALSREGSPMEILERSEDQLRTRASSQLPGSCLESVGPESQLPPPPSRYAGIGAIAPRV